MKITLCSTLVASLAAALTPRPDSAFEATAEATLIAPGGVSTTRGEYSPWYDVVHEELLHAAHAGLVRR